MPTGVLHLVGDSQCAGAGMIVGKVSDSKRWRSVKSTCKVGTSVSYWSWHFDEVAPIPGDAVVIYLGSNDWAKPDPTPILKKVAAAKAKCVWVGPPIIRGKDNGVADHLKSAVEADGTCKFLDSRKLNLRQEDGVHPGPSEHVRWLTAALSKLT